LGMRRYPQMHKEARCALRCDPPTRASRYGTTGAQPARARFRYAEYTSRRVMRKRILLVRQPGSFSALGPDCLIPATFLAYLMWRRDSSSAPR
jgi:hypothetical protein